MWQYNKRNLFYRFFEYIIPSYLQHVYRDRHKYLSEDEQTYAGNLTMKKYYHYLVLNINN